MILLAMFFGVKAQKKERQRAFKWSGRASEHCGRGKIEYDSGESFEGIFKNDKIKLFEDTL